MQVAMLDTGKKMEAIGLSKQITEEAAIKAIFDIFPSRRILSWTEDFTVFFLYDGNSSTIIEEFIDADDILAVQIEYNPSEFPTKISVYRTLDEDSFERGLYVALQLSERFECSTIINCPAGLVHHPYCSLIIKNNRVYQADDLETVWGDGQGGEVRVLHEIEIKRVEFDRYGRKKASL